MLIISICGFGENGDFQMRNEQKMSQNSPKMLDWRADLPP